MAASFKDVQLKIDALFRDNWTVTPAAYENVNYEPPQGVKEWVRMSVLPGDSGLIGLNGLNGLVRSAGVVIVQIFVIQGIGAVRAMELADQVSAIFRNVTADGILYRTPSVTKLGVVGGSGWYQVNVSTDFQWDNAY